MDIFDMFPIKFDTRNLNFLGICLAAVLGLLLNIALWFVAAATIAYGVKYGLGLNFLPQ